MEKDGGDDRCRFCFRCSKTVYDLSAMTEDEAESFLAIHLDDEDAGVRLYRRPDGRMLTSDCPVGAKRRHTGRAALAAVVGAIGVTALAAVLGDIDVPRPRSAARAARARFEPPRSPPPAMFHTMLAAREPEVAPLPYQLEALTPDDIPPGQIWGNPSPTANRPKPPAPSLRQGAVDVSGDIPSDIVRRIVRQNFGRFRLCYENGLSRNAALEGRIAVSFDITRDGSTANVRSDDRWGDGTNMPSPDVTSCVVRGFTNLAFPSPERGVVKVTYRIGFTPPQ